MSIRIALAGNPNCGKTTLFNALTGSNQYVGNWPGVTVEKKEGKLKKHGDVVVTDLPGIYSLSPYTLEEVVAAAKAAHCHSFIKQLPQGYDTPMGEDGGGLSQGQRQLLCIARVMLCLPPMLILDEATSSIDTRTELKIQNAFAKMMEGRTSFIVAHRLSTIRNADIILVMKDGHIIEKGNHEQLLERNGFYAKLYYSGKMETEKA